MTVAFRTVLDSVLGYCQTFFDATDTRQQGSLNAFLQLRVDEAWLWGPWPEWTYCERRGFADPWAATLTYGLDEVVFVAGDVAADDTYYKALQASTGKDPETETTYWAETTVPTDTTIAMEQAGMNVIGRVWNVANGNVAKTTAYQYYDWTETPDGIYVAECGMAAPWVHYSLAPRKFSSTVWTSGAPYVEGDVVMSPQTETTGLFPARGECYRAAYDTNGAQVWVLQTFPRALARFVALAVASDMQRQYGKPDEADGLEGRAYAALSDDARKAGIRPAAVVFSPAW
jgi:hypothetical protein